MLLRILNVIHWRLQWLLRKFYSSYIKLRIRKVGKKFSVSYPINLIGGDYIEIGENVFFFSRIRLEAYSRHNNFYFTPYIFIGNNVSINYDCHIGAINKIVIEDNVLIGSKVLITDHSHGEITSESLLLPPSDRKLYSKGPVVIRQNVWIGEGVAILPGVEIGENSIIGANSVITKNVPPNCVVGGNPARILKKIR